MSEHEGYAIYIDLQKEAKLEAENAALRAERDALQATLQRAQLLVVKWRGHAEQWRGRFPGNAEVLHDCADQLAERIGMAPVPEVKP